jgi:hypothetical protein
MNDDPRPVTPYITTASASPMGAWEWRTSVAALGWPIR